MKKNNRIMLVGAVGSGKSTLIKALNKEKIGHVRKTQSLEYAPCSIDTPGEFVENPSYYRALFATSLEADRILFIQDATKTKSVFPPGFAAAFSKAGIGVVTKIDHPEADINQAVIFLKKIGLSGSAVCVSALKEKGIKELRQVLNWN